MEEITFKFILAAILTASLFFVSCERDDENSSAVSDGDGNIYETIIIGDQEWFIENLSTTTYNDGTPIELITDNKAWTNASNGAYCWYNNDESYAIDNIYGALYNWYTVETGKLCPLGWHVPTDEEWIKLENYLARNGYNYDGSIGGQAGSIAEKIAKALASSTGWESSTGEGSIGNGDYPKYQNKSGFSALPGGSRHYFIGEFSQIGGSGYWWSSTENSTSYPWYRGLDYDNRGVDRQYGSKEDGFSVRCIKDKLIF